MLLWTGFLVWIVLPSGGEAGVEGRYRVVTSRGGGVMEMASIVFAAPAFHTFGYLRQGEQRMVKERVKQFNANSGSWSRHQGNPGGVSADFLRALREDLDFDLDKFDP